LPASNNRQTLDRPATTQPAKQIPGPRRLADGLGARATETRSPQLARFSGLFILALFIAIFAAWIPGTFLTATTLQSILGNQAITVVLSIGLLITLAAGQYDLSVAQNLGLSAVVCGSLMAKSGVAPALAVVLTLAMGAGIGAVNGAIVSWIGVNSFIATLGMSSILLALTEQISKDEFIGPVSNSFQQLANRQPLGIPIVTIYALLLALLVWYVLEHTPVGRRIYATGANPDAARLAGIGTGRHVFWSFVATGVFAALAGVLVTAKVGEVSSTLGPPYLLPAFAACFLGTTQFKPGRFNTWGTVLALYLLETGVTGLQLAGGQLWITDLFNGVALVGAVSVSLIVQRRRDARSRARTARRV
jgi:ribose transport system permease protein